MLSLPELEPTMAELRSRHQLNLLSIEALAAPARLDTPQRRPIRGRPPRLPAVDDEGEGRPWS